MLKITRHKTIELAENKRRSIVKDIIDKLLIYYGATDITIEQTGLFNNDILIKHQGDKVVLLHVNNLKESNIKLEVTYYKDAEELLNK